MIDGLQIEFKIYLIVKDTIHALDTIVKLHI